MFQGPFVKVSLKYFMKFNYAQTGQGVINTLRFRILVLSYPEIGNLALGFYFETQCRARYLSLSCVHPSVCLSVALAFFFEMVKHYCPFLSRPGIALILVLSPIKHRCTVSRFDEVNSGLK